MPKVGETRTRVAYTEATQIRDMLGLTGSMITSGVVTSAMLSKLAIKLTTLLKLSGFKFGADFAKKVVDLLIGKTLSKYKVKFTTKEQYVYERVFDTHEWIDAYMWAHRGTSIAIVKK